MRAPELLPTPKNPRSMYAASKRSPRRQGAISTGATAIWFGRHRRVLVLYQHCFGKSNSTIPNEMSRASALRGDLIDGMAAWNADMRRRSKYSSLFGEGIRSGGRATSNGPSMVQVHPVRRSSDRSMPSFRSSQGATGPRSAIRAGVFWDGVWMPRCAKRFGMSIIAFAIRCPSKRLQSGQYMEPICRRTALSLR